MKIANKSEISCRVIWSCGKVRLASVLAQDREGGASLTCQTPLRASTPHELPRTDRADSLADGRVTSADTGMKQRERECCC